MPLAKGRTFQLRWFGAAVAGLGLLFAEAGLASAAAAAPGIAWRPCADPAQKGFDCATVRVPLDYGRPRGAKIRLAVIRHRASDRARRVGVLFYDPGGPGVSGVKFFPPLVDTAFASALRARFDLVSWDPRGVGASTAVQCFASERDESSFFAGAPTRSNGGFPVGRAEMSTWIERYRDLGRRCEQRNGRLLRYVSTADTARDLDLLRRGTGERALNYIGTSYGTFLGAVYANLFPGRVRAMALDGDLDPSAWVNRQQSGRGGVFLSTGLRQRADESTAKTLRAFLDLCGRTDTAHCAFSAGSPPATRAKFAELLRRAPLHARGEATSYADVVSRTVVALYSRFQWGARARVLQDLWANGATGRASRAPAGAGAAAHHRYAGEEQELAIACGETPNPSTSAFPMVDALAQRRSGVVGPYWAWDYEPCASWPVRSAHRYAGPWNRRTAKPVLVIGTTFDPATRYEGAVAMARQLARARLLTVDGYGHTALLNLSACVNRYESGYFINGALPPRGARCRQDARPFDS